MRRFVCLLLGHRPGRIDGLVAKCERCGDWFRLLDDHEVNARFHDEESG